MQLTQTKAKNNNKTKQNNKLGKPKHVYYCCINNK